MLTVLRHRDFSLLFWGQAASVVGDGIVMVALGLYVTRLTGDPSDVGLVLGAYAVPLCVFVLFGGVLADRLPRQRVMVASDLTRAALHGTLAVLIASGAVRIWQMVLIGVLFGTAEAFFRPAYTGLVPQTVPEPDIQQAQALNGMAHMTAEVAGPTLATALVLGVGGAAAFGLDAATFLVSAALLWRVRGRERGEPQERTSVLSELREGGRAVAERAWVWATVLAFSVTLMVGLAPFFVLGATVSDAVYGTDAVFGFANAAYGVGMVTGAVISSRWQPERPMRVAMAAVVPWPLSFTVFSLGPSRPVLLAAFAVAGSGIGLFAVLWETALAQRIPPHLLSRVSAWDWMGSLLLLPVGYLLAGPAAEAWGQTQVMTWGGLIGAVACALGLLPRSTRDLRRHHEPELALVRA